MQVVDYNQDGFDDLLITNGDNWDYTNILKAYHGVRVHLNDGKNNFKEALFYPLYGANQAIAADFDGDGYLDIAAIFFQTYSIALKKGSSTSKTKGICK